MQNKSSSIYNQYPNRIKQAEHLSFASEVYHFVDDKKKYIQYKRNEYLLQLIKSLKSFQNENNEMNFKQNLEKYFGKIQEGDNIRMILNLRLESFHAKRNINHPKIQEMLQNRQPPKGQTDGVDQWGHNYSQNEDLVLSLPAEFRFNQDSGQYELHGVLCKQIENFPDKYRLGEEIAQLVTYFSPHLKAVHENYSNFTYNNMVFLDTKEFISFDENIHAIISITEITISPNQSYVGPIHKEGISQEGVLYQCLYIPQQSSELSEASISFFQNNPEEKPNQDNSTSFIPLGDTTLQEHLMIIFPNCNLHQVSFKNRTNKQLSRIIVSIQVINHIDQPFTLNEFNFKFDNQDFENNHFALKSKTIEQNNKQTSDSNTQFQPEPQNVIEDPYLKILLDLEREGKINQYQQETQTTIRRKNICNFD